MTPILVGSVAASVTNCLPSWRGGYTGDVDFYGDDKSLIEAVSARCGVELETVSKGGVTVAIDPRGSLRLDLWREDGVSAALREADDLTSERVMGIDCLAISEASQLALKLAYIRNNGPHNEKNARDIEFWLNRSAPVKLAHLRVFEAMWYKSEELFGLEKSPPHLSWGHRELLERMNGTN